MSQKIRGSKQMAGPSILCVCGDGVDYDLIVPVSLVKHLT